MIQRISSCNNYRKINNLPANNIQRNVSNITFQGNKNNNETVTSKDVISKLSSLRAETKDSCVVKMYPDDKVAYKPIKKLVALFLLLRETEISKKLNLYRNIYPELNILFMTYYRDRGTWYTTQPEYTNESRLEIAEAYHKKDYKTAIELIENLRFMGTKEEID